MADLIALRRVHRRRLRLLLTPWRLVDRKDPFKFTDKEFFKNFRLSKYAVKDICEEIRPHMSVKESGFPIEMQVLSSLYFLGSGNFQRVTGENGFLEISQPSVSRYLKSFVDALQKVLPHHIKFPVDAADLLDIKCAFYENTGFPNCVGALGCTHVHITKPTEDDHFAFINKQGRYSINVQMVCDYNMRILDVVARWPGGNHDAFIWQASSLREIFSQNFIPEKNFLLGDSGYPLEPWLLTPYTVENLPRHKKFNEVHRKAHNIIQQCFGVLKSRWRCLHDSGGILNYAPDRVCKIITACAVLHNFCIRYNIDVDTYDEDGIDDEPDQPDQNPGMDCSDLCRKGGVFREEISLHL